MSVRAPVAAPLPAQLGKWTPLAGFALQERAGQTRALLAFLVLCVASRTASTIRYIEDTDSLRFALSLQEYSVEKLQPHFPGYPVFWAVAKVLYEVVGSYAIGFSLIGAVSIFGIGFFLLRIVDTRPDRGVGLFIALLVFFNPLMWLMSNRYMPDLMGLAWAMAAFHFLAVSTATPGRRGVGMFLAGMLAGVRLSYLPFLLPPVLVALAAWHGRARLVAAGTAGVLVWLIPFWWATGTADLLAAATRQTAGHFTEFGGTVITEPRLTDRLGGLLEGVLADGLGGFWMMRHPLTLLVTLGLLLTLPAGAGALRQRIPARLRWLMAGSWVTYLIWIAAYQNVIDKSRHVLPLLPFLLLAAALGCMMLWKNRGRIGRVSVSLFLAGYAAVTLVLVAQHKRPTAIAQVTEALRAEAGPNLVVASIPLVNFYLEAQGIDARFLTVESAWEPADLEGLPRDARILAVGRFPVLHPAREVSRRVFYHNPYVNRMWSEIEVYEYDGHAR